MQGNPKATPYYLHKLVCHMPRDRQPNACSPILVSWELLPSAYLSTFLTKSTWSLEMCKFIKHVLPKESLKLHRTHFLLLRPIRLRFYSKATNLSLQSVYHSDLRFIHLTFDRVASWFVGKWAGVVECAYVSVIPGFGSEFKSHRFCRPRFTEYLIQSSWMACVGRGMKSQRHLYIYSVPGEMLLLR